MKLDDINEMTTITTRVRLPNIHMVTKYQCSLQAVFVCPCRWRPSWASRRIPTHHFSRLMQVLNPRNLFDALSPCPKLAVSCDVLVARLAATHEDRPVADDREDTSGGLLGTRRPSGHHLPGRQRVSAQTRTRARLSLASSHEPSNSANVCYPWRAHV